MRKTKLLLLLGLAVLVVAAAVLAFRNPPPPPMPADRDHAVFRDADACLACHGPDGVSPQSRNHPIGRECMRCHGG